MTTEQVPAWQVRRQTNGSGRRFGWRSIHAATAEDAALSYVSGQYRAATPPIGERVSVEVRRDPTEAAAMIVVELAPAWEVVR